MTPSKVYLDHNASAPLMAEARKAMTRTMALEGNPSSVHAHGRALAGTIEEARKAVAGVAGAEASQTVFTGSASEAITQAIVGGVRHFGLEQVIVSAGEHAAVSRAAKASGVPVHTIALLSTGEIDLKALEAALSEAGQNNERVLVAMHWVNNETGVVQPLKKIEAMVGPTPHFLFVDAVQAFAKSPMGFASSAIDMMAISSHKIGGPAGVGALLMKPHCNGVCLVPGGGQEQGRRGGTQSAMLIAGFGAASEAFPSSFDQSQGAGLIGLLEENLRKLCPELKVFGHDASRIGCVSNFALPGVKNTTLLMGLDLEGISVSTGSACSSGKVSRSPVLEAMGVPEKFADCAIRISVGWTTTRSDIECAVTVISEIYHRQTGRNGKAA